ELRAAYARFGAGEGVLAGLAQRVERVVHGRAVGRAEGEGVVDDMQHPDLAAPRARKLHCLVEPLVRSRASVYRHQNPLVGDCKVPFCKKIRLPSPSETA